MKDLLSLAAKMKKMIAMIRLMILSTMILILSRFFKYGFFRLVYTQIRAYRTIRIRACSTGALSITTITMTKRAVVIRSRNGYRRTLSRLSFMPTNMELYRGL